MKRILISTGEKSGEILAKSLVVELKNQYARAIHISGMAGNILSPYLDETIIDSNDFGVVGFIEALYKYRILKSAQNKILRKIKVSRFDMIILVDFIGFNLTVGRFAKKFGIPVILYVGPQIWAWKKNRIRQLKESLDFVGLILPFEETLYKAEPFKAVYVGNPLVETLPVNAYKNDTRAKFSFLKQEDLVISFLPGSRTSEIKNHFFVICETILKLHKRYQNAKFIISLADETDISMMEINRVEFLRKKGLPLHIQFGRTHDVVISSDYVGTASGTASLETALLKIPCVIFYKSSLISYLIFKIFSLTKYVGLPNIIMEQQIVPELLQSNFNTEKLYNEMTKIIETQQIAKKQILNFYKLEKKLGSKKASKTMASIIKNALSNSSF